jgi:hypothetical protein
MAKDEAELNTPPPAPAIPKPERLFLNEAVELVVSLVSTFEADAVWQAIGRALADGRLRDCGFIGPYFGSKIPLPTPLFGATGSRKGGSTDKPVKCIFRRGPVTVISRCSRPSHFGRCSDARMYSPFSRLNPPSTA